MTKRLNSFFITLFVVFFVQLINAQAAKATTGTGLYKDKIYWLNWDLNINGSSRTFTSPSGTQYVATVSNVSGTIVSDTPNLKRNNKIR